MEYFKLKTENFEGPLDLLYQMIQQRKLQINTISLSKITGDYLKYVKNIEEKLEDVSNFVYIASILILIKSKSLLSIIDYTNEETEDIFILEERLKIYKFIKEKACKCFFNWGRASFFIVPEKQKKIISFNSQNLLSKKEVFDIAKEICYELSFLKDKKEKKVSKTIRLEDVMNDIVKNITNRVKVSFETLPHKDKREKILSFLAILELFKNNLLSIFQDKDFSPILIDKISRE